MIRLLDLPGVEAIENRLTLNQLTGVREDHELDRMVGRVIGEVFNVGCRWDWEWTPDNDNDLDSDEDIDDVTAWRRDGWDVTARDGSEARCLELLEWAMEVVQAGVGGRPKLEIERDMWARTKEAETRADPRRAAQNAQFVQLGGRGRRRSA